MASDNKNFTYCGVKSENKDRHHDGDCLCGVLRELYKGSVHSHTENIKGTDDESRMYMCLIGFGDKGGCVRMDLKCLSGQSGCECIIRGEISCVFKDE